MRPGGPCQQRVRAGALRGHGCGGTGAARCPSGGFMHRGTIYIALALTACDGSIAGTDGSIDRPDSGTTPIVVGDVVTGVYDVDTALPDLPPLERVVGHLGDDGVTISIDPIEGARDYRVY